MANPSPLARLPLLPTELLSTLLAEQSFPTTLIICSRREPFISSLLQHITAEPNIPSPAAEDVVGDADDDNDDPLEPQPPLQASRPPHHPLLTPTLHQISVSRHLRTVFVPTISHLRAYLSVFPGSARSPPLPPSTRTDFEKPGTRGPLLVVYGLVELHRDTSEWSAQGLGRSVAGLVEAGRRAGRMVWVVERRGEGEDRAGEAGEEGGGDEDESEGGGKGRDDVDIEAVRQGGEKEVWRERMPILNGSSRRGGGGGDGEAWAGRTVEVRTVLGRWFRFEGEEGAA